MRGDEVGQALTDDGIVEPSGDPGQAGEEPTTRWAQQSLMGRYAVSIGGGTDQVLRNNIGERSLGLPREPGYDKSTPWRDIPK